MCNRGAQGLGIIFLFILKEGACVFTVSCIPHLRLADLTLQPFQDSAGSSCLEKSELERIVGDIKQIARRDTLKDPE